MTPAGASGAFICTLCGVLLGLHAWWTFAQPVATTYDADFSGVHWIQATLPGTRIGSTGYFRKKFYVASQVNQAWISVAATDYYEVCINGTPLTIPQPGLKLYPRMSGSFISGEQEAEFDLTPYILPGENCITVYVRCRMIDRTAALLVKGMVSEYTSKQWIYSDSSWKAKPVPDDMVGQNVWTEPYMSDDTWPNAQITFRPVPGTSIQPMAISPAAFDQPIAGYWIATRDPSEPESYFRRDFYSPWGTKDTWLLLSTTGNFEVYLNNRLVTNTGLLAELQGSAASTTRNSPASSLNDAALIDLQPWLSMGKNRLEIRADGAMGENALLAQILAVQSNGTVRAISSNSSWLARGSLTSGAWALARELAPYGAPPYGYVLKLPYPSPMATQEIGRETFNGVILGIFVLMIWWVSWIIFSRSLADRFDLPFSQALILDALAQVPLILVLALLWISSYDIRFHTEWGYQPVMFWLVVAGSILLRCALWRGRFAPRPVSTAPARFAATRQFAHNYGFGLALAVIVVFAFVVRVSGLMTFSLDQDEIFIRNVTHGIIERGFPSIDYHGLLYRLTTYELIPWPEFVCAMLTGWQDWSLRVPGLIYGTLLAGFIGLFGSRMFDRRTGLLAAATYACMSWDIHWSRHAFHLQQTQFSAFLCFYTYYLAIRKGGGIDAKYFPLACVLFCTTYLSWEGSGFILPAFAVAIVALHPTDWRWLKQFHFWTCFCFVAALVLVQLCDREITLPPYLGLGSGLSDITSPSLNFLDPNSDLHFYLSHFFFSEAHVLLIILVFLGLPLCWSHQATRYVMVLFFTLLGCYSGLLPVYSVRYSYFYQPLLVLGGCAVAIQFYDRILMLAASVNWPWTGRWARWSAAVLILLVFMAASETGIKIYRVAYDPQNPDFFSRQNDGYVEYKLPADYINAHFRPGDTVVGPEPHTFIHYSDKSDNFSYGLNSLLLKRMYYIRGEDPAVFNDRYSGTPSFRNMLELQDGFWNNHRVWIVGTPQMAMEEVSDQSAKLFLEGISRLVYEDGMNRVYLWDGGGDPSSMPSPQGATIMPGNYGAAFNPALFSTSNGASGASSSSLSSSTGSTAPAVGIPKTSGTSWTSVSTSSPSPVYPVVSSYTISLSPAFVISGGTLSTSSTTSSNSISRTTTDGGTTSPNIPSARATTSLVSSASSLPITPMVSPSYTVVSTVPLGVPGSYTSSSPLVQQRMLPGQESSVPGAYTAPSNNPATNKTDEATSMNTTFVGGGSAPAATITPNHNSISSIAVNPNSSSTYSSTSITGPQPTIAPTTEPNPYKNIIPPVP